MSESKRTGGNFTDTTQTGEDAKFSRAGDQTNSPAVNETIEKKTATKLANLLEGLPFPATKEDIKNHLNKQSPAMGNRINDVLENIHNQLEDDKKYDNVYEIELATGLVKNNSRN